MKTGCLNSQAIEVFALFLGGDSQKFLVCLFRTSLTHSLAYCHTREAVQLCLDLLAFSSCFHSHFLASHWLFHCLVWNPFFFSIGWSFKLEGLWFQFDSFWMYWKWLMCFRIWPFWYNTNVTYDMPYVSQC